MSHAVIQRDEMLTAQLDLGGAPIDLAEYATTGLLAAVGPRAVWARPTRVVDGRAARGAGLGRRADRPGERDGVVYGAAVRDAEHLGSLLETREQPMIVVTARDAAEFLPYGRAILDAAERIRKPLFVVIDEGQLFSATKKRKEDVGEAAEIINEFAGRGRKRRSTCSSPRCATRARCTARSSATRTRP